MFLDFDNYFINLAKVTGIDPASEFPHSDVWDLFITMDDTDADSETIWLYKGFQGTDHAYAFRNAVLRFACTQGVCTKNDMDQIYEATRPG
jgi:hypothetical protein